MNTENLQNQCENLIKELKNVIAYGTQLSQRENIYDQQILKLHAIEARVQKTIAEQKDLKKSLDEEKIELQELHRLTSQKATIAENKTILLEKKSSALDERERLILKREDELKKTDEEVKEREKEVNRLKAIIQKEQDANRLHQKKLEYEQKKVQERANELSKILE